MDHKQPVHLLRPNVLPMALDGAEATDVSVHHLRMLRVAIAEVVGPTSSRTSTDLALSLLGKGSEVDPAIVVVQKRVHALRRLAALDPAMFTTAKRILARRNSQQLEHRIVGPLGLLCESLAEVGGWLTEELDVVSPDDPGVQIRHTP